MDKISKFLITYLTGPSAAGNEEMNPSIVASWSVRENPLNHAGDVGDAGDAGDVGDAGEDSLSDVMNQPVRKRVVKVTEMLRRLNDEDREAGEQFNRRRVESESEEERTDASMSRRSSGADSGVGILSESEFLDYDQNRLERKGVIQ